ncbi:hypothetical protein GF319_05230 [Candidatus Bathyarchaeota archaeon]|nr:hypothetical protein [Candidatus Bathyarchaeota archaeon]
MSFLTSSESSKSEPIYYNVRIFRAMADFNLTDSELESLDIWKAVEDIKEKILWETENDDPEIQAMMISFEVNQIVRELLELSISFTRNIVVSK